MAKEVRKRQENEQQQQQREERARASRRRNRQLIGLTLAILIVVGAVSIVMSGVGLIRTFFSSEEAWPEYEQRFAPMVWFDILPFESVTTVDENTIKQIAIWGALSSIPENERSYNEYEEPTLPSSAVDQYGIRLFGPDFRFSGHSSFYDQLYDLTYTYDETTRLYTLQATGLDPAYLPTIVDVQRESGGVRRVTIGYVSTRNSANQVVATLDYEHPAKYLDYMLQRDGNQYYLFAIRPNTTLVPQPGSGTPAIPDNSFEVPVYPGLEDDSLPLPASSAESIPASETDSSLDASGSQEDASDTSGTEDSSVSEEE